MKLSKNMKKPELYRYAAQLESRLRAMEAASSNTLVSPRDAALYVLEKIDARAMEQEHFWVVWLNARQQPLGHELIAKGSLSQVDVHPRSVFRSAVRMNVHAMIIVHNHPSGDPKPSESDIALTRRMRDAGELMGIPILDHLIVTGTDFVSLASLGLVF